MKEIGEFVEIVKVYFKYHIYLWIICVAIFCLLLTLMFPQFLIFIIAGYAILMIGKDLKFGWSGDKIRNLLMYKNLTKSELTPMELEVLDKHFGRHERKKIIMDHTVRRKALRKVLLIDILMLCLSLSILIPFGTRGQSNNPKVFSVSGKVLMVEFAYETGFMSQTRQTRIYFHNGSILLHNEISLEIGKYYRIWYEVKTLEVLHVELLEK